MSETKEQEKVLIFGKTGWIGGKMGPICTGMGMDVTYASVRLQNREALEKELDRVKPDRVINAAGVTGRPNVDWCEDNKQTTIRSNVIGVLNLVDCCHLRGIHVTNLATGCIFSYDEKHQLGSGVGFTEDDKANFDGSFYSFTKGLVEQMLRHYDNCLTLRVRMPISDDMSHRNFITKIVKYDRVVNIPNSMTILHDMLPIVAKASRRKLVGVYNFTNPGTVSHNQILDLYKKYIDESYEYENFTEEEQNKILKAARSNNELDSSKLMKEFPEIPHVDQGIIGVFERMKKNMEAGVFEVFQRAPKKQKTSA